MSFDLLGAGRAFVAAFVVMNVFPIIPVVLAQVGDLPPRPARTLLTRAWAVGAVLAALVVLLGPLVLRGMGLDIVDMRIAGGLVLLVFAIYDLLFSRSARKRRTSAAGQADDDGVEPDDDEGLDEVDRGEDEGDEGAGVVPLGVPIIMGPAVLATLVVLTKQDGVVITLGVLGLNLVLNLAVLLAAPWLWARLPHALTGAAGKVMSLLLAAIAVSMVRAGATEIVDTYRPAPTAASVSGGSVSVPGAGASSPSTLEPATARPRSPARMPGPTPGTRSRASSER
jgi:multiple antibiotic resistance protein